MSKPAASHGTVTELVEDFRAIQQAQREFKIAHADFVSTFPKWMGEFLPNLAFGQALSETVYRDYSKNNGHSLTEGQHPHYAVMAPSFPTGNPYNVIGAEAGSDIGRTLVYRVVGSAVLDAKRDLTAEPSAFVALATQLKKLDKLFYVFSTGSMLVQSAYQFYKARDEGAYDKVPFNVPKTSPLYAYMKQRWAYYDLVKAKGVEHFERKLDLDIGDPALGERLRKKLVGEFSEERRFVRAMSMLLLESAVRAIEEDVAAPKNGVIGILQGCDSNRLYVWNPHSRRFVVIPDQEDDELCLLHKQERFIEKLPEAWRDVAPKLIEGAREFKRATAAAIAAKEVGYDVSVYCAGCSDSRAPAEAIFGPHADHMRHVLREPGAFMSKDGKLLPQASLFCQMAEINGRGLVITQHATCGAMQAVDMYGDGVGDTLPQSFKDLGEERKALYEAVRKNGGESFYIKKYDVPVKALSDCMALQQALDDYDAVRRAYPDLNVAVVYQNMTEPRNYLLNPRTGKFVAIPAYGCAVGPQVPQPRRAHSCSCGCGS